MEEQFQLIMEALAEIERQVKEERATLAAVRKFVEMLANDRLYAIESKHGLWEAQGFHKAVVEHLRTLLNPRNRATQPLTLVKP
jgi:hypothetical protein